MHYARSLLLLSTALVIAACGNTGSPVTNLQAQASPPPSLTTLAPNKKQELNQKLKVNVVFVGYEQGSGPRDINVDKFKAELAKTYRTQVRYPAFYGLPSDMGISFNYDYNLVFASSAYENSFFNFLKSKATTMPLSVFQRAYNKQSATEAGLAGPDATNTSRTITSTVGIPAPEVEKYLANNAPAGVDTTQYTVYFINWYGRSDFKDHFYTKFGEPDPDSGYDFAQRSSRKLNAWGGTAADDEETGAGQKQNARVWFYDLSAGPEGWTGNWDITNKAAGYRMPPVWEYGTTKTTYRPFDNLSGDLGKVTRYTALNLLFTASPLYNPALSAPELPKNVQMDVNLYSAPGLDATAIFKAALMTSEVSELDKTRHFSTEVTNHALSGRDESIYNCFVSGKSCFGNSISPDGFGDLFKYHQSTITKTLEGDADYELPIYGYFGNGDAGLLGFADDNWANGTQSFVFGFDDPQTRETYGLTTTLIHEAGHHLAMSHPHDGYDYETNNDYGDSGAFAFVGAGDMVNSMMSYIDLNWDFSQFDRDNMNRYMTSTYINQANVILGMLTQRGKAGAVATPLKTADASAKAALNAYATMNYAQAAQNASSAYFTVLNAAYAAGVKVEPQAWPADYKAKSKNSKFVDTVDPTRALP